MPVKRLTTAEKNAIIARIDKGGSNAVLSREFGVSEPTITYYRHKRKEGITQFEDPPPKAHPARRTGPSRRFSLDEQNDILRRLAAGERRKDVAESYGVWPSAIAGYVHKVRAGITQATPRQYRGGGWPKGKPRLSQRKAKPGPAPQPEPEPEPVPTPTAAPPVRREAHNLSVYERGQIVLACTRGKRPVAEVADEYNVPHDYVQNMVKTALGVAVRGVSVWI